MPSERNVTLLKLCPLLVMCIVFLVQFSLARSSTLSPWKGGGFGMFATQDSLGARFVEATGTTEDGEIVRLTKLSKVSSVNFRLSAQMKTVLSYPNERVLAKLAKLLLIHQYVPAGIAFEETSKRFEMQNPGVSNQLPKLGDAGIRRLEPFDASKMGHTEAVPVRLSQVTLRVWRSRFVQENTTLSAQVISESSSSIATEF